MDYPHVKGLEQHFSNGSPVSPGLQEQIGLSLITWQMAPIPHLLFSSSVQFRLGGAFGIKCNTD